MRIASAYFPVIVSFVDLNPIIIQNFNNFPKSSQEQRYWFILKYQIVYLLFPWQFISCDVDVGRGGDADAVEAFQLGGLSGFQLEHHRFFVFRERQLREVFFREEMAEAAGGAVEGQPGAVMGEEVDAALVLLFEL